MTQKIFDTDNAEDMALLWSILPDCVKRISPMMDKGITHIEYEDDETITSLLNIEWYGKSYIDRPIQEATEADIGKICAFWEEGEEDRDLGILVDIGDGNRPYRLDNRLADFAYDDELWYDHCRRLTKQEIEEIC